MLRLRFSSGQEILGHITTSNPIFVIPRTENLLFDCLKLIKNQSGNSLFKLQIAWLLFKTVNNFVHLFHAKYSSMFHFFCNSELNLH